MPQCKVVIRNSVRRGECGLFAPLVWKNREDHTQSHGFGASQQSLVVLITSKGAGSRDHFCHFEVFSLNFLSPCAESVLATQTSFLQAAFFLAAWTRGLVMTLEYSINATLEEGCWGGRCTLGDLAAKDAKANYSAPVPPFLKPKKKNAPRGAPFEIPISFRGNILQLQLSTPFSASLHIGSLMTTSW